MKPQPFVLIAGLAGVLVATNVRAEKPLALANGDFEQQLTGWNNNGDNGMSVASAAAARSGKFGLRVTDTSETLGSNLATKRQPAAAGKSYEVRFAGRLVSGSGVGVYLRFFDAKGVALNTQDKKNENIVQLGRGDTEWKARVLKAVAPAETAQVEVWIHSYTKNIVTADFDDFVLVEL